MTTPSVRIAFPPGEFIREELEARGWTQTEFAAILGRPLPAVNQIINGNRAVTPETAKELAEAFGTSPEFWMNLESQYRLSRAPGPEGAVKRRAERFGSRRTRRPRRADAPARKWPAPKARRRTR